MKWKVKYQDLLALKTHHPFYNLSQTVEAESKEKAIEIVKDQNYYGDYGNYKASRV